MKTANQKRSGFTLIEMLTTIVIIGLMAAIIIPSFGNVLDSGGNAKDLCNAQQLAATSAAASAAGLDFVAGSGLETTVRKIVQGAVPTSGAFKNYIFKVPMGSEAEIVGAMRYLAITNGKLVVVQW
jgi:prepilin-type N-terminal cleavage/methylation domain-containing protein